MSVQITVRDVPERVRDELAARAAAQGRSMQEYLRAALERLDHPIGHRNEAWLERCRAQMHGALGELENWRANHPTSWMAGDHLTQADVTVTCCWTFLADSVALEASRFPHLTALAARCEALPAFVATRRPWTAPRA